MVKMIISGMVGAALLTVGSPVHADPCAGKKDAAERVICKMAAAKTPAEADALSPSLGKLGADAVPQIRKVLKESKNGQLRAAVACAVGLMEPAVAALIPDLVRVLSDQYVPIRLCALKGVAAIGPSALAALPGVLEGLKHKDIMIQLQAMEALVALWPVAPGAIPVLVEVLDGKRDKRLKYNANKILARFGAMSLVAIPALRKAMFAPDQTLQSSAVAVVAAMAPASWPELPSLIKLASETRHSPEVRKAAALAMAKMGKYGKKYEAAAKKALGSEGAPAEELKAALQAFNAK